MTVSRFLCICAASGLLVAGSSGMAMANNVQARLEGSLLKVFGDSASNDVVISQSLASDVEVRGRNGTKVNGRSFVRFRRLRLNAMEIRMKGGNDAVRLKGLEISNDLYINLAEGDDLVLTTGPNRIGANMTIEGNDGRDTVRLTDLTVDEDLYVDGGEGPLAASIVGLSGGKCLTVIGGDSNDVVEVRDSVTADTMSLETKKGNDRVSVATTMTYSLAITTDEGSDEVTLTSLLIAEDLGIFTGTAADVVNLEAIDSGKSIKVSLDTGNDYISGENVFASQDAVLEGGDGRDTLVNLGIRGEEKTEFKEFETILP